MSAQAANTQEVDPPLFSSPQEERRWNRLSEQMSQFHQYFKQEFNQLHKLADGSFEQMGLSLRDYLRMADSFDEHLTMHHTIEENYFFPKLGKKLPQFDKNNEDPAHIKSHKGIHDGLENLGKLVSKWKAEPTSYSPDEMRACLDGFKAVLFHHLDEEVEDLKGSNLKKHFTLEEYSALMVH